ncbi:RNA polymerase sporulation sigma factor SigH [Inconstantimicrobium porci]|uniref:RNA polymerase sporulation sigma factor SigH n=1 Tax=Inconstantimicrobium porci TaxID=2652291 RepID=A0A7X2MWQ5_9CLOT|nr:RNA polymerase sporulation sigma factor SigH [Inconstantimicrobium porci]MDD6769972.1 RNA polymerase sporulation sigma factor SigH [Inconstantimicrobium porci]MSR90474.1 RNA polymerase sporulation sigma factor SigH [Inconstantimicrobium porci]
MSGSTYAEVNYDFKCRKDEEVVCIAQKGNKKAQEYMINKYESCVKAKAKSYFLIGADKEDIYQEGMIGLYKAIRDFNSGRQASFKAFAELCISRQIITAIKTATRQKHIPLNTYISLNKPIYDDESDRTLLDILSSIRVCNPEELIVSQEEMVQIEKYMAKSLSELEKQVLNSYMDGKTYQEIACTLDRDAKSIDNALQRVKRKLENCLKY